MKLKKIISAAVGATMLCASLPFSSTMVDFVKDNVIVANAEDEMPSSGKCGDNVYYSLSDDGVLTISGTGKMYDYDHETANPSPLSRSSVKSVVIENGVTSIGDLAFFACENLEELVIPDSVTSIGEGAFFYTKLFENKQKENPMVILDNILIDGTNCNGDIVIPDSVTLIGDSAFSGCTDLTEIKIPNSCYFNWRLCFS